MIAVQGLGYVTAHNWAYIAPFGCRPLPQLVCRRGSWSRFQSRNSLSTRSWWLSTTSPAILQRLLQHSAPVACVVGEFAAMGRATVLLERTRTICIGYGLIAGMG